MLSIFPFFGGGEESRWYLEIWGNCNPNLFRFRLKKQLSLCFLKHLCVGHSWSSLWFALDDEASLRDTGQMYYCILNLCNFFFLTPLFYLDQLFKYEQFISSDR